MNTQPETNETLQAWVTPRLQRLNQADGTDKHVLGTESVVFGTGFYTSQGGCATSPGASGGGGVAAVCGPS